MPVEVTHIRMSAGGTTHEHITDYKWCSLLDGKVDVTNKPTMVDWIENKGGKAYVGSGANSVPVLVVHPTQGQQPYLRSRADGEWTNNLLSLPRF